MECPVCHKQHGLYIERLPDGRSIICCLAIGCKYKSEPQEHPVDLPTRKELDESWK